MNENENTLFADFESAFSDDPDYQTGDMEEPVDTGNDEDLSDDTAVDEPFEADDDAEDDGEETPQQEQPPADTGAEDAPQTPEVETFTLKVNKEEKTYSREEVISLAQKGADYDRVKEKAAKNQGIVDQLQELAKASGTDVDGLITGLQVSALMKQQNISEEVARERVRAQRAEQENARLKAEAAEPEQPAPTAKDRVAQEIAEFQQKYPKVELTETLVSALMDDVRSGTRLTDAYEKHLAAQKDERIRELEAQLAAEKQNKKNRAGAIGSQRDSGGRRSKTDFDHFEKALFG